VAAPGPVGGVVHFWGGQLIPDAWASLPSASGLSRGFCIYDANYAVGERPLRNEPRKVNSGSHRSEAG